MKKILLVHDNHYLGEKSGGPYHSVRGLFLIFSKHFETEILTKIEVGENIDNFSNIITHDKLDITKYHCIVINSFFTLTSLKLILIYRKGFLIIMPRGELMKNVLHQNKFKFFKKIAFIYLFKILTNFLKPNLFLGCTNNFEIMEVNRYLKNFQKILMPNVIQLNEITKVLTGKYLNKIDTLQVLFFSRIDRKKNIELTLKLLSRSNRKIEFNIYGYSDDKIYFKELNELISNYNSEHLKVYLNGFIDLPTLKLNLSKYHLFVLHSFGENFCHSIVEMFFLGIPCLISDNTPWKNIEKNGLGWDVSNSDENKHIDIINNLEKYCLSLNMVNRETFLEGLSNYEEYQNFFNTIK